MSKKTRYLIIASCFTFFILASPLIVLYVKGIGFDFETGKFYKTGILAVRIEPKSTNVFLNAKLVKKSEGNIKFLKPAEYFVALEKAGYQKWSKRLEVNTGKVTWANPANNKIYLFLESPQDSVIKHGALSFYAQNGQIFYLTDSDLTVVTKNLYEKKEVYGLPKQANLILDFSNQDYLFLAQKDAQTPKLGGVLMFDVKNKKFIDLGTFLSQAVEIEVSPQNEIFFLEKGGLYKMDAKGTKKTLVDPDINGFLFEGGNFYYLKNNSLFVASAPSQLGEKIVGDLPEFSYAKIFINFNKQAYLLLDKTLYKVSNNLEKLAENVSDINFNRADSSMAVVSGSEILRTLPGKEDLDFITRSTEALYNPRLANNIDYCLFLKNNKIIALELDARDKQNEYVLYQGKNVLKFEIDGSGENLTVLDGMELKNVKIR